MHNQSSSPHSPVDSISQLYHMHNRSVTGDKSSLQNSNISKRKKIKSFKVNLIEQKIKNMENQRLWKRLSEINNRKKKKFLSTRIDDNQFCTINLKSREVYRQQKNKQIQEQNNMFVQRMVKRLNSYKSIFEENSLDSKSSKRINSRKKHKSFALPSLYL